MFTQLDDTKELVRLRLLFNADGVWKSKSGKYLIILRTNLPRWLADRASDEHKYDTVNVYSSEAVGDDDRMVSNVACKRDGSCAFAVRELIEAIDKAPDYSCSGSMFDEVIKPLCQQLYSSHSPLTVQKYTEYRDSLKHDH